jgi:hypothetical protein
MSRGGAFFYPKSVTSLRHQEEKACCSGGPSMEKRFSAAGTFKRVQAWGLSRLQCAGQVMLRRRTAARAQYLRRPCGGVSGTILKFRRRLAYGQGRKIL